MTNEHADETSEGGLVRMLFIVSFSLGITIGAFRTDVSFLHPALILIVAISASTYAIRSYIRERTELEEPLEQARPSDDIAETQAVAFQGLDTAQANLVEAPPEKDAAPSEPDESASTSERDSHVLESDNDDVELEPTPTPEEQNADEIGSSTDAQAGAQEAPYSAADGDVDALAQGDTTQDAEAVPRNPVFALEQPRLEAQPEDIQPPEEPQTEALTRTAEPHEPGKPKQLLLDL